MTRVALYPGSFDPFTNGHADIVERALRFFDVVHIGVGENSKKKGLFSPRERVHLIQEVRREREWAQSGTVDASIFQGSTVDAAKSIGANAVIRGLRSLADFEYELQFAHVTKKIAPEIECVFFMTNEKHSYLSSSLVKELFALGHLPEDFVSQCVKRALEKKSKR